MSIGILFVLLPVVLFVGTYLALLFSYMEKEAERSESTETVQVRVPVVEAPSFFTKQPAMGAAVAQEVALRQIEHHLRREVMVANLYVEQPSAATLWLGRQPTMEVA